MVDGKRPLSSKRCTKKSASCCTETLIGPSAEVDIKFVSYKCCFLLALASGRRRSEVHPLSVSDSCLRFNRNQSAVNLLTDPSFLGKNQIPSKGSEPIFIPVLPSESSADLLCPIRILKIY
jgi:hypothetical protein